MHYSKLETILELQTVDFFKDGNNSPLQSKNHL
jgi:hypothetical protein